jgi:hypothetical protein
MTIAHLMNMLLNLFATFAPHVPQHHVTGNSTGWLASKNLFVEVCRIPSHLHGTFTCTGWVKR